MDYPLGMPFTLIGRSLLLSYVNPANWGTQLCRAPPQDAVVSDFVSSLKCHKLNDVFHYLATSGYRNVPENALVCPAETNWLDLNLDWQAILSAYSIDIYCSQLLLLTVER